MKWFEWNPGEADEGLSVNEVLNTLPASPIEKIPAIVRLLENPSSPYHLAGPASLGVHDILHTVLGRGLLQQDEAFVIGYSVGNSENAKALDRLLFMEMATKLYRKPFRFSETDALVFDLAFDVGMKAKKKNIHKMDPASILDMPLGEARAFLGVGRSQMLPYFKKEVKIATDTKASMRLKATFNI
ncbi:MAG: hypothetical protein OIF58_02910 [Cohaesibacter sp.]|nr:hypothetical protein [Cohaesibacter sp.]